MTDQTPKETDTPRFTQEELYERARALEEDARIKGMQLGLRSTVNMLRFAASLVNAQQEARTCETLNDQFVRTWLEMQQHMRVLDEFVKRHLFAQLTERVKALCECGHPMSAHLHEGCCHPLPDAIEDYTGRRIVQMCRCKSFSPKDSRHE